MSAASPSKIRWSSKLAAALLLGLVTTTSHAQTPLRFATTFEGQDVHVLQRGDEVETVLIAGGQVQRRARGLASAEFRTAARAVEWPAQASAGIARGSLIARSFYFLADARGAIAGPPPSAPRQIAALRTAARSLALELPSIEIAGLYVLAYPTSARGPQEEIVPLRSVPAGSPLRAAIAAPGFPVRVADAASRAKLPRHSVFTLEVAPGRMFLVSYAEGPPFSLREWLQP